MNKKIDIRVVALVFFAFAVLMRFVPHSYNVSAIGALGMFVGCMWSARIGFLMALAAMALSDMLGQWMGVPSMGVYNPALMITVYVAIGLSAVIGRGLQGRVGFVSVPAGAVAATVVFFLITNFAAWLDPQMPYARTPAGLIECYVAAIPFVKNTLIGNLLYTAVFFGSYSALTASVSEKTTDEVRIPK